MPYTDKVLKFETQTFESKPPETLNSQEPPHREEVAVRDHETDTFTASHVYSERLRSNEFRLLVLPGTQDDQSPVHVELETWFRERCPEYEATSYLWGGDDDDSTPADPVFVGPFWDVLMQTKNCHSMLEFLRPSRGLRVVRIDVICINQQDIAERADQLAAMAQVCSKASQVVMYLGPAVAYKRDSQPPLRKYISSLTPLEGPDNSTAHRIIKDFFAHRYFTRCWIIQEVVFARRLVCQIHDNEYWIDYKSVRQLKEQAGEKQLGMPVWADSIAVGTAPSNDIVSALRVTSLSFCSDPRDVIFAALPLYDSNNVDLQAHYSISPLHVLIGVHAYVSIFCGLGTGFLRTEACSLMSAFPSWMRLVEEAPRELDDWYQSMGVLVPNFSSLENIWSLTDWRCSCRKDARQIGTIVNRASGTMSFEAICILSFPQTSCMELGSCYSVETKFGTLRFRSRTPPRSLDSTCQLTLFASDRHEGHDFFIAQSLDGKGNFRVLCHVKDVCISSARSPRDSSFQHLIPKNRSFLYMCSLSDTLWDTLCIYRAMIQRPSPGIGSLHLLMLNPQAPISRTWSECWDEVSRTLFFKKWYISCCDGPEYDMGHKYRAAVGFVNGDEEFTARSKSFVDAMGKWSNTEIDLSRDLTHISIRDANQSKEDNTVLPETDVRHFKNGRDRKGIAPEDCLVYPLDQKDINISMEDIVAAAHLCVLLFLRLRIWKIARRTGEDEQSLLTREPRPQDKTVGDPWCWPHEMVEGMGIKGGRYFINLV